MKMQMVTILNLYELLTQLKLKNLHHVCPVHYLRRETSNLNYLNLPKLNLSTVHLNIRGSAPTTESGIYITNKDLWPFFMYLDLDLVLNQVKKRK